MLQELSPDPVAYRPRAEETTGLTGTAKTKLLGEKQPSLEFATPEQIGATALFLCSPAAAQIRAIALPVDGGWTAQ
jgi:3-hydroxybutyrate dehydrogenase